MITGESGSGKSSVLLALAYAVAVGEPFLGKETRQRPVLIVDLENGLPVYVERFKRFGISKTPNMRFWGTWDAKLEPEGPDYPGIRQYVLEHKPLIIFDSLVAFHPGSEQDADETRAYMHQFRQLAAHGATVIVIHHTGKADTSKEYRGSSDIKAAIDVSWVLTARKPLLKHLKLHNFKSREGEVQDIDLALEGEKFVQLETKYIPVEDPDFKTVQDILGANPGANQLQLFKLLPSISVPKVRKILTALEASGKLDIVKGLHNASLYTFKGGRC